ncbi:MAG: hypothetical protein AAF153_03290, partial [Pseudomonadota bacterium]
MMSNCIKVVFDSYEVNHGNGNEHKSNIKFALPDFAHQTLVKDEQSPNLKTNANVVQYNTTVDGETLLNNNDQVAFDTCLFKGNVGGFNISQMAIFDSYFAGEVKMSMGETWGVLGSQFNNFTKLDNDHLILRHSKFNDGAFITAKDNLVVEECSFADTSVLGSLGRAFYNFVSSVGVMGQKLYMGSASEALFTSNANNITTYAEITVIGDLVVLTNTWDHTGHVSISNNLFVINATELNFNEHTNFEVGGMAYVPEHLIASLSDRFGEDNVDAFDYCL